MSLATSRAAFTDGHTQLAGQIFGEGRGGSEALPEGPSCFRARPSPKGHHCRVGIYANRPWRTQFRAAPVALLVVVAGLVTGCSSGASHHLGRSSGSTSPSSSAASSVVASPSTTEAPITTTTAAVSAGLTSAVACGTESPPAPAAGGPISVQVTDGTYAATLTGTVVGTAGAQNLTAGRLLVTDNGRTVVSTGFTLPKGAGPAAVPSPISASNGQDQPLCLAQFPGSPFPTALVGFFTGGAHCCTILAAIPLGGRNLGVPVYRGPADTGVEVKVIAGSALIVTADSSFDYEFASHAGSGMPIVVLEVQDGQLGDVTRQHRDVLDADDQQFWNGYLQDQNTEGLGSLAAWVADECRIGTSAHAFATLDLLNSQSKLQNQYGSWPSGSAYISQLKTFLSQHGYC